MTTYLHDEMIDSYKILIFYSLRQINEPDIRRIIWEKILTYEEEQINDLINQAWYEDIGEILHELHLPENENLDYSDIYYELYSD